MHGRLIRDASAAGSMSFAEVEARLVEAIRVTWRGGDRERSWLTVRCGWPEIVREATAGDYDARGGDLASSDVRLRPASLTRAEVAAAEEALGWLGGVDGDDGRLIGLALRALARGEARVPWRALLAPMGLSIGAYGLSRRYQRAMARVVARANGRGVRAL